MGRLPTAAAGVRRGPGASRAAAHPERRVAAVREHARESRHERSVGLMCDERLATTESYAPHSPALRAGGAGFARPEAARTGRDPSGGVGGERRAPPPHLRRGSRDAVSPAGTGLRASRTERFEPRRIAPTACPGSPPPVTALRLRHHANATTAPPAGVPQAREGSRGGEPTPDRSYHANAEASRHSTEAVWSASSTWYVQVRDYWAPVVTRKLRRPTLTVTEFPRGFGDWRQASDGLRGRRGDRALRACLLSRPDLGPGVSRRGEADRSPPSLVGPIRPRLDLLRLGLDDRRRRRRVAVDPSRPAGATCRRRGES